MAKGYLSNRQRKLKIGISSYTENDTSLEVIGKVGIGTTNAQSTLHIIGNALISGVVTATTFVGNLTGTASYATTSGISTNVIGGIGSITQLQVTGISTFTNGPVLVGSGTSTGTASQPLQVTGGAYVSGNLGVGNTNPIAKLEVFQGTGADAAPEVRVGGYGYIDFHNRLGAGGYNPITSADDKGIIFTDGSPGTGNFIIAPWSSSIGGIRINNNGELLLSTNSRTGTASQPLQVTGGAYFSGSVGIGSTNPQEKLDVQGGNGFVRIGEVYTGYNGVTLNNSTLDANYNILSSPIDTNLYINRPTGQQMRFRMNNSDQMILDSSGNLLINTTTSTGTASQPLQVTGGAYVSGNLGVGVTNPLAPLHINSSSLHGVSGDALLRLVGTGGGNYVQSGITLTSNSSAPLIFGTIFAGSEWARFASTGQFLIGSSSLTGTASQPLQVTGGAYVSGNLGVGVTNPTSTLMVQGNGRFVSSGQGDVTITHSNLVTSIRGAATIQLVLGSNNTDVIRINNSSQVGIATTNPVATLQVKDALAFETTNTTTTTTSQVAVDTFATATFRSAKYQVQVTCPGQISTLGGITTGGRGYTSGTFNVTFTTSSGTGSAAQGTLVVSNGTVGQISVSAGGTGYVTNDVLTASGGSGLQVSVASTGASGAITGLTLTSSGIGYTAGVGVGTTSLTLLGGTGFNAVGLATIFDGVITSSTLLQQPTTGTGGTVYYSGSNYTTSSVLSVNRTDLTNTITTITGSVGVSTFTSLTAHGLFVNDIIRTSSTSNGLTAGTDYYVVTTPDTTSFTLGTSLGVGITFTTGTSLSIGFYRNSANAGGQVTYTNAITGVSTNYQVSDVMVLQNGTTTDFIEYASLANNDILGTFATDISGANARLLFTPTYPDNTIKLSRQAITV